MRIEERELTFTSAVPLRAWRLFRVGTYDHGLVLASPMYHNPDPVPWPRAVSRAVCYKEHPAPAPGCRCGIYAVIPGVLDSLPGYLLDTAYNTDPWAYGQIACTGRVFLDMRGVRTQRAEILNIALAESCWRDEAALADAQRQLCNRYEVPVSGLEQVPDWVTLNQRTAGPPPDDATLDLDTLSFRVSQRSHPYCGTNASSCRC